MQSRWVPSLLLVLATGVATEAFAVPLQPPCASATFNVSGLTLDLGASHDFCVSAIGIQRAAAFDIDADLAPMGSSDNVHFTVEVVQFGMSDHATHLKLMTFEDRAFGEEGSFPTVLACGTLRCS